MSLGSSSTDSDSCSLDADSGCAEEQDGSAQADDQNDSADLETLKTLMQRAAEALDFEKAATLRDRIKALQRADNDKKTVPTPNEVVRAKSEKNIYERDYDNDEL